MRLVYWLKRYFCIHPLLKIYELDWTLVYPELANGKLQLKKKAEADLQSSRVIVSRN
jgi:hypothetical protein